MNFGVTSNLSLLKDEAVHILTYFNFKITCFFMAPVLQPLKGSN